MKNPHDPLHDFRAKARDHILRSTVRVDEDLQRAKQAEAALKHDRDQAEREQYLASLTVAPSTPNPVVAPSRFKPRFKPKPRAAHGKVALARANQKERS